MARERYLVGLSEEELRPNPKPEPPKTPKGKLENYWYHYKWHTIGGIAALVVLVILAAQILTRTKYDYDIVMATENYVSEEAQQRLINEFAKYAEDLNGDGKINISLDALVMNSQDTQVNAASIQKLAALMASGDTLLFILDKETYDVRLKDQLESDQATFFAKPQTAIDGIDPQWNYWNWNGSQLKLNDAFNDALSPLAGRELYFGVRHASGTASKKQAREKQCMALFDRLLAAQKVDYQVVMTTQSPVSDEAAASLTEALKQHAQAPDGAAANLTLTLLPIGTEDKKSNNANIQKLNAYLAAGDTFLFVFDKATYDTHITPSLETGQSFFSKPEIAAAGLDEQQHYWNWTGSSLRQSGSLAALPDEVYFGVWQNISKTDFTKDIHARCLQLFEDLLAGEASK